MARPTRTILAGAIALVFGIGLLAGPASPASAHDGLVSSTPGSGESATASPSTVTLTFSGEILEGSPTAVVVEVTDAAGTPVSDGDAVVDGVTVTQQITPDLPDGDYTVTWRVVSSDGHPISADFHFFIAPAAGADTAPTPTATVSSITEPSPTAEPTASAPAAADGYGGQASGGGEMFPILLVAGVALTLGVLLVTVLRMGQKRRERDARDAAKEETNGA